MVLAAGRALRLADGLVANVSDAVAIGTRAMCTVLVLALSWMIAGVAGSK